ncbi:MAG: TonB-dependent receptor [Bacteroidetes bacterium]|nr:TonB-dependent receptor [Bacteroidota bacterium]
MKLTSVLLIAACLQVSAKGYAQKVTLHEKNISLQKIFAEIRKQTGYQFFYADEALESSKNISIDVKKENIKAVLDSCFKDQPLTYTISENTIIVKQKFTAPDVFKLPQSVVINLMQITGKVTDANGQPLAGASILEKGTNNGVKCDANGRFTINVNPNATLIISYISYETAEIQLNGQTDIAISLKASVTSGEQIVVVGYGTQKKSNLSTSIASVNSGTIQKLSITRVEQALQGNASGVLILNQNGQPGDKPMIRIRGTGTNNSPDPLFLVDGFPVGSIEYLNPNDIERIDVLKDAASAAIYGSRGANGVVLITTKTGKKGAPSVTYDGYYGLQTAWRKVPLMNAEQYATMMNESYTNLNPTGTNPPYANPSALGNGTDWQNVIFNPNSPVTNHQISISGATDKINYLTSFNYFDQQGIIGGPASDFKRYSFRLNLDAQATKYLKVGTNMAFVSSNRNAIFDNGDQGGSVVGNAVNIDPITPLYETDPAKLALYNVNAVKNGTQVYGISPLATFPNPAAQLAIINGTNRVEKIFGNVFGEVNLAKGLKFRSTYGIDLSFNTSNQLIPIYFLSAGSGQSFSTVKKSISRSSTWQTENTLSYTHSFSRHQIEALIGQSAFKYFYEDLSGQRNDPSPIDPNMAYIDVATDITSSQISGTADVRSLASYFGRLAYNYSGKYFVSAVLRRDGSSRFGRNNPFATFPSASVAWLISKENFFKSNLVSLLKLRGSWGQNGNENLGSSFPWASTINFNGQQYTFLNNGGVEYFQSGASLGRISNPYLKWETSEQTDIGLDAELWQGKLAVTADYYIKKTKDLLIAPDVPIIVGFPAPFVNGGSVENKGVELALNYNATIKKDLSLNLSFNISHNVNKVTAINNSAQVIAGANYINMGSITRMAVGQPIGYFWGNVTKGIFQSQAQIDAYTWTNPVTNVTNKIQPNAKPGDLIFADNNNDGKISDLDRVNIGDPNPKYITGFTVNLAYKNFDLNILTIGMFGQKVFNGNYRFDKAISNLPLKWLNRWTPTNTNTNIPRFAAGSQNFTTVSDFYLEDGNFARIKTLQLGYNFPADIISRAKISGLRIYFAVDNAFTFTKYTGFDPELGATSPLSLGIDRGVYPQSRVFRFGVNVKL